MLCCGGINAAIALIIQRIIMFRQDAPRVALSYVYFL